MNCVPQAAAITDRYQGSPEARLPSQPMTAKSLCSRAFGADRLNQDLFHRLYGRASQQITPLCYQQHCCVIQFLLCYPSFMISIICLSLTAFTFHVKDVLFWAGGQKWECGDVSWRLKFTVKLIRTLHHTMFGLSAVCQQSLLFITSHMVYVRNSMENVDS